MALHSASNWVRAWFDRNSELYGTRMGLLVTVLMATGGIALGSIEASLAVQTSGYISAVDILISLLFLTAVKQGMRTADVIHNYGYGKYESLGILFSTILLMIVLVFTLIEAVQNVGQESFSQVNYPLLLVFSAATFLTMRLMSRMQSRYAERFHMQILQYDADLWLVDSVAEAGVLANLVLGATLHLFDLHGPAQLIDSLTAIAILVYSLRVPITHARQALSQLLDKTLPEEVQLDIITIIGENIAHICEFKNIHTRRSGRDLFMELDVILPFDHTLEQAFEIEALIQQQLTRKYPNAIVRMYVEPCNHECESDGKRFCPIHVLKRGNDLSS